MKNGWKIMLAIHYLTFANRKYINSGIHNGLPDESKIDPNIFSKENLDSLNQDKGTFTLGIFDSELTHSILGDIPNNIEQACNLLGQVDPRLPQNDSSISNNLKILENCKYKDEELLLKASILAFRIKFIIFQRVYPSNNTTIKVQQNFIEHNIPKCWDVFEKIFSAMCQIPQSSFIKLLKYVSRFAHFYQAYQAITDITPTNMKHAESISILLHQLMIRHAITVIPVQVGATYWFSKIIRELIIRMHHLFPKSDVLRDLVLFSIAVSYDYLSCLELDQGKALEAQFLLVPKREMLDSFYQINQQKLLKESESIYPVEVYSASVLSDVVELRSEEHTSELQSH